MRYIYKILSCFFVAVLICCVCNGCNNKDASTANGDDKNMESRVENETDSTSKKSGTLTIPSNRAEKEELFGTTDKFGRWTAPKASYTDPKTGQIYNKEGIVIGNKNKTVKPNPDAVG